MFKKERCHLREIVSLKKDLLLDERYERRYENLVTRGNCLDGKGRQTREDGRVTGEARFMSDHEQT